MAEMLLNWVADTFAHTDIIDLYFIVSDLIEIPITEAELGEVALYDAMAMGMANHNEMNRPGYGPIGKMVL